MRKRARRAGEDGEPTLPRETRGDGVGGSAYRIRVAGVLGDEWSMWTEGMRVTVLDSSGAGAMTELAGNLPDQAALMGVLERLYNHGARLLRVECLDA